MVYRNFKFRAYFECSIPMSENNNNHKDISFKIYDIAVYDNGECGIYVDELIKQLSNLGYNKFQIEKIFENVPFNDFDGEWVYFTPTDLEQFTGVKDAKGKDIFDGDIIKNFSDEDKNFYNVYFENGCFGLDTADGFIYLIEEIDYNNHSEIPHLKTGIIC